MVMLETVIKKINNLITSINSKQNKIAYTTTLSSASSTISATVDINTDNGIYEFELVAIGMSASADIGMKINTATSDRGLNMQYYVGTNQLPVAQTTGKVGRGGGSGYAYIHGTIVLGNNTVHCISYSLDSDSFANFCTNSYHSKSNITSISFYMIQGGTFGTGSFLKITRMGADLSAI